MDEIKLVPLNDTYKTDASHRSKKKDVSSATSVDQSFRNMMRGIPRLSIDQPYRGSKIDRLLRSPDDVAPTKPKRNLSIDVDIDVDTPPIIPRRRHTPSRKSRKTMAASQSLQRQRKRLTEMMTSII